MDDNTADVVSLAVLREQVRRMESDLENLKDRHEQDVAILDRRHQEAIDQIRKEHGDELRELKSDRDKALRWGISVLGSAVIVMVGWLWTMVSKKLGL